MERAQHLPEPKPVHLLVVTSVAVALWQVDIDMKLRSCKGSCATYHEYQVDQQSYVTLEKQVGTAAVPPHQ